MQHYDLQMVGFALYKETFIGVEKLGEKYRIYVFYEIGKLLTDLQE